MGWERPINLTVNSRSQHFPSIDPGLMITNWFRSAMGVPDLFRYRPVHPATVRGLNSCTLQTQSSVRATSGYRYRKIYRESRYRSTFAGHTTSTYVGSTTQMGVNCLLPWHRDETCTKCAATLPYDSLPQILPDED